MQIRSSYPFLVLCLLLAPVAMAGRLPQRTPQQPAVPATPAAPGSPQQARLTPADDWVSAVRAGGTVLLGPGEFTSELQIEIFTDLNLQGAGIDQTFVTLDSAGGDYREQFAIVGDADQPVRVSLSDMSFVHGGSHRSDLITVWGRAHLEANRLGVGLAADDFLLGDDYDGGPWYGSGIAVVDGATANIIDSYFYGNMQGIAALEAGQVFVSGTAFMSNLLAGIYVEHTPITVTSSHFELNDIGIELLSTVPHNFTDNIFVDQHYMDVLEY